MPLPAVDGDEAAANAAALAMGAARAGSAPAVPLADRIETLYDTVYKFQTRLDELTAESTTFGLDYKSITVGDGQLCRWWRLLVTSVAQVSSFYSMRRQSCNVLTRWAPCGHRFGGRGLVAVGKSLPQPIHQYFCI